MTAAGWYNAEGDPPGTTRYWDGTRWVGDPVHTPAAAAPAADIYGAPGGGYAFQQATPLRLASPGSRIGARLIDVIIIVIGTLLLLAPALADLVTDLGNLDPNASEAEFNALVEDFAANTGPQIAIAGIAGLLWDFLWVALLGATPGKLILGLRVAKVNTGASPPGWGKAALRAANRAAAMIPLFGGLIGGLVGLVSLVLLFSDKQHQTVMDKVASTVVIKK